MQDIDHSALEQAVASVQLEQKGPGGAIGIVRNGKTVLARTWGHADIGRHMEVTARTRFPICSISKHW